MSTYFNKQTGELITLTTEEFEAAEELFAPRNSKGLLLGDSRRMRSRMQGRLKAAETFPEILDLEFRRSVILTAAADREREGRAVGCCSSSVY